MNGQLSVADISSYLEHAGWRRRDELWRGAALWTHIDANDLLVPARDGMGDSELRVAEIVEVLAIVEQRPEEEIVRDINSPNADQHWYRTFSTGMPSGFTTLRDGAQALHGMITVFGSAARAVIDGPHFAFSDDAPALVSSLVNRMELAPTRAGSYVFPVRVPLGDDPELTRRVSLQLLDATVAVRDAAVSGDLAAFDSTVSAGVSAELCEGMRNLAGADGHAPFEIGFRWARGLHAEVAPESVTFPMGSAEIIAAAADHLRRRSPRGEVTVTGVVEGLHDQPAHDDRWRIRIRGEIAGVNGSRRVLWARLSGQDAYSAAIAAHQERHLVRARGALSESGRRAELITVDFEVLG
ncbi:hypothetical protein DMH03_09570 [Amycolatopsis sp. WAC 01376]|uniref:hypothetical protein n=1 Tax=Amycolatopsis sp. WAC 01376 TaxID=2203195 RepID=UPI000F787CB0|nr:hypothetical protein [Amycolatopsis sp. WAC 01376]RSM62356.1 hypothetical protein DMH03_09570 [Amycolatopsis sp. WAC 01376]